MKEIYIYLVALFSSFSVYSQDEITDFKFLGYQDKNPVFLVIQGEPEPEMKVVQEQQEVASDEAMIEEAVMEASDPSGLKLLLLNESTGKTEMIPVPSGLTDVLSYSNENLVGTTEYSLKVVAGGEIIDFDFQEDWSEESDFREQVLQYAERFNMVNVTFSPDGTQLLYPVKDRLKIRSYHLTDGTFSQQDFSYIDEYGGSLLAPVETANTIYFLARLRGPFDLFKMTKGDKELTKFPFDFGRRSIFGLKFHPTKEQLLFIYNEIPFALDFDLNKSQPITIPEISVARKDKIKSDFEKVFYSHHHKEWRYGTLEGEQLMTNSLEVNEASSAFVLDSARVEKVIDEKRMKNRSPKEELRNLYKKLKKIPQPLSNELKSEINDAFSDFEQKYASRADEPEMQSLFLTIKILKLDTALFSEKIIKENKELLIKMVRDEKLDYEARIGLQILAMVSAEQPQIHPARVAVLQALVDDYLKEHEMTNANLESSGIGMLLYALKANGNYEEAITYNRMILDDFPEQNFSQKQQRLEEMIQLQLSASNYKSALATIAKYNKAMEQDGKSNPEKQIKAGIYKAHAFAGLKDFDQAFELLDAQEKTFKDKEEEIFGSNTKSWLKFSLKYAYTTIHYKKATKEKEVHLENLLDYLSANSDAFLYKSMYAETLDLLESIGEQDQASLLPVP